MKALIGKNIRRLYWAFEKRKTHLKTKWNCNISTNCKFEGYNSVGENTLVYTSNFGYASYVGKNCNIVYTEIGRYCSIGDNLSIIVAQHPLYMCISTHPAFYSTMKQSGFTYVKFDKYEEICYKDSAKKISVSIGSDVWIGNNVSIKGGITVGHGAVIGANSLVLKDIEPYAIYGGVPARKLGYRFKNEEIEELLKIKWWDWDTDRLKQESEFFFRIEDFIEKERV